MSTARDHADRISLPARAIVVLALAASACAAPRGATAPPWFPDGGADWPSDRFIVATGACGPEVASPQRPPCAHQAALEQAALHLEAHVEVDRSRSRTHEVEKSGGAVRARAVGRSHETGRAHAAFDFDGVQPAASACVEAADTCYVLVAIDRSVFSRKLRRRHDGLAKRIDAAISPPGSPGQFAALRRAISSEADLRALRDVERAIWAVDPRGVAASEGADTLEARRRAALASLDLAICAEAGSSIDALAAPLVARLREVGVQNVRVQPGCDHDRPLVIAVSAPRPSGPRREGALFVSMAEAQGVIVERGAKVSTLRAAVGRGVARDPDAATRDAMDALAADLTSAFNDTVTAH